MLKGLLIWNIILTIFLATSIWGLIDLDKERVRHAEVINKQTAVIYLMGEALDKVGIEVPLPELSPVSPTY